jgi:hypothetical protein
MNIGALLQAYTQLRQNPSQMLSKLGIPQEYASNPQGAIQYLMNSGKVSQEQFNNANSQLKQMQNNPMFKQFFGK